MNYFDKARHELNDTTLVFRMDSAFFSKEISTGVGQQNVKLSALTSLFIKSILNERSESKRRARLVRLNVNRQSVCQLAWKKAT